MKKKNMQLAKKFQIVADEEVEESPSNLNKDSKESAMSMGTNQIFFYDDVTRTSIYMFNRNLDMVSKQLQILKINFNLPIVPPVELYINSPGGEIFSAFSAVDRIRSNPVPVHSYCEGIVASAATLLSVVAAKRYIKRNSFMLIHQLSSGVWGNFEEIQEEYENLELLMHYIKSIYLKHTKFTETELDSLLKHDIYLDAEECLSKGLVDEIV